MPFLLTGLFLILAPLSVATGLESQSAAKYLRVLTSVGILLCGLLGSARLRFGGAARAWLLFGLVWLASALWSDSPGWAMFHKVMFFFVLNAGIILGASIRSLADLERGVRFLGLASLIAAVAVIGAYLKDPNAATAGDRLALWGMNANLVAQTAAPLTVFCLFLTLNSCTVRGQACAALAFVLLLAILVMTGSRGGAVMALAGVGVLLLPYMRRPVVVMIVGLSFLLAWNVSVGLLDVDGEVRLVDELTKDTRESIWKYALRNFEAAPVFGLGWLHWGSNWAAVQGAYLQVLVEAGLVGAAVLVSAVLVSFWAWRIAVSRLKCDPSGSLKRYLYFSGALVLAPLVHGLAESSTVMGTSLNPLLLGFGASLLDRLPGFLSGAVKVPSPELKCAARASFGVSSCGAVSVRPDCIR